MNKLNLKATAEATALLFGFFTVGIIISFFFDPVTSSLFRAVILEWGAFPMLCAIIGGVVSSKQNFMPLYGVISGVMLIPFALLFFEELNWYLVIAYGLLGMLGSLFGYFLFLKEVKRIEEGKPEKRRRSVIFSLFDRYGTKKYK